MSLFRKPRTDSSEPVEVVEPAPANSAGAPKGRPTPKRRTKAAPPVPAPRTRKEAVAWQKEHAAKAKVAGQRKLTPAEYRQAVRKGDPTVLPRRDQGPVRQLARDYVDSRRMGSNYLLLLFPLMFIGYAFPPLQITTLLLFVLFAGEWMYSGYRIRKLAMSRGHQTRESFVTLGMYAGGRAYFPRKWRRPQPRVAFGDEI
ncbi:MAG TPA: DUF3043 domain-containing protein [Jatrophihabitans sp.]|nr:DUF3043 domain-containing protein [Jatrophihabitans sp.]